MKLTMTEIHTHTQIYTKVNDCTFQCFTTMTKGKFIFASPSLVFSDIFNIVKSLCRFLMIREYGAENGRQQRMADSKEWQTLQQKINFSRCPENYCRRVENQCNYCVPLGIEHNMFKGIQKRCMCRSSKYLGILSVYASFT